MPKQLPRDTFVGTTAIFFAATNWLKVPAYVALGQFSYVNMRITAMLLPIAILSTFAGVKLVRYASTEKLYKNVYVLMILVGCKLVFDAF